MNKTEARFAEHLKTLVLTGEILWWMFESITFKLGEDCRYTPDFAVLRADHVLVMIDTKGTTKSSGKDQKPKPFIEEDARAKIRSAPTIFPILFQVAYFANGEWILEDF